MSTTELERIETLARIFATGPADPGAERVLVGIGDDCAVLLPGSEPLVWTIDASVEGVHFRREWLSFEDIGYRATMAAASDLAAMGAEPAGVLSALILPPDVTDADLFALATGQRQAVAALGTALIGGNLARGAELSLTTTVLGRAPRPVPRRGARPGDALWLLGPVGLAAAGLRLLIAGHPLTTQAARACVAAWRRPRARISDGLAMRPFATAAIDLSDGLARDVAHLAHASGVRAVIALSSLETPELAGSAAHLSLPPHDLALFGGEDYALAFAAPHDARVPGAVRIGWFEPRDPPDPVTLIALTPDGAREPLSPRGFDHFAR